MDRMSTVHCSMFTHLRFHHVQTALGTALKSEGSVRIPHTAMPNVGLYDILGGDIVSAHY